jgi:hypothetical protein
MNPVERLIHASTALLANLDENADIGGAIEALMNALNDPALKTEDGGRIMGWHMVNGVKVYDMRTYSGPNLEFVAWPFGRDGSRFGIDDATKPINAFLRVFRGKAEMGDELPAAIEAAISAATPRLHSEIAQLRVSDLTYTCDNLRAELQQARTLARIWRDSVYICAISTSVAEATKWMCAYVREQMLRQGITEAAADVARASP